LSSQPSLPQLQAWIRAQATDSSRVFFTKHARTRMRQRGVTHMMALEVLQQGVITQPPEPDMRFAGLKCRMQRLVCGIAVAVVVYVEYPAPHLVVVTVIDL